MNRSAGIKVKRRRAVRTQITPKIIRRLVAADGYMELNMPHRAVTELEKVDSAGPLEGPRRLLLGMALKRSGDEHQAIPHLEAAARMMPSPVRRFAWSELSSCYRSMGSDELADLAEKLGGESDYELRIALPSAELTISSTETFSELI
jgi:predicted Zn-dependent protease